ncbi:hypothetical protein F4V57_06600 [Acinetobacter qingfengensis]|uniref:Uncharacterized protein n=1 Tax=Acinetobacter qingfengensis TaxID=1262585 RepID=A0A1E7RDN5_9GAMM|nr:hypothetical protein [Acinetobacter qingfengensis]KAA8733720.1 hypothetical protein F4V57_06600 [Acinetobacter qingfengensis]OEY97464.1 hypothetical protein BJI46_09535 [Acinetobacter qingfengensis]
MQTTVKNTQRYNIVSAIFAFCLWGGWSFYVNSQSTDWHTGVISGLAQGICSFIITLCMTFLIEKQFNFYQDKLAKSILPPLLTVILTGSCLFMIHYLIATPNIIKTISPALTVALLFAFFTNFKLYQQSK